jgi:hypothetical protein
MAIVPRVYRPNAFLRLRIRLEDFTVGAPEDTEAKPYAERVKILDRQIGATRKKLAEARTAGNQDQVSAAELSSRLRREEKAKKKLASSDPQARAVGTAAADEFSVDLYTVPTDLSVDMNSFRMADKCHASFPFIDAPLMSDIIRAALVEVWIGTVTPEDFAAPDHWRLRRDRAVIVFRGYVDTWETTHDDQDAQVQIDARSLEAILIDAKINPLAKAYRIAGSGEKISTYVDRILAQFPPTAGKSGGDALKSAWYGAANEPVIDRKILLRSLQTAKSRTNANGGDSVQVATPLAGTDPGQGEGAAAAGAPRMPPKAPGQEMSLWDLITQACEISGCIPTYDPSLQPRGNVKDTGDFILLRPPQTIYGDALEGYKIAGGPVDGFRRRFALPGGSLTSEIRFLVWGHNITSFKTSRKLGRIKVPGVEVISYNPDAPPAERRIAVLYPTNARTTRIGSKGEGQINEIQTRNVSGIRSKALLKQVAVGLYHSMSRQELSVTIETDDLASYIDPDAKPAATIPPRAAADDPDLLEGQAPLPLAPTPLRGHNDDPDMLRLRPGSPCRVVVAREVRDPARGLVISPLSEVFEKRGGQLLEMLKNQQERFRPSGFRAPGEGASNVFEMAARITKALSSVKLTDLFYCRSISHKFNGEDGWSATLELVNFLEARNLPSNLSADDQRDNNERKLPAAKKAVTRKVARG